MLPAMWRMWNPTEPNPCGVAQIWPAVSRSVYFAQILAGLLERIKNGRERADQPRGWGRAARVPVGWTYLQYRGKRSDFTQLGVLTGTFGAQLWSAMSIFSRHWKRGT